MLRVYIFILCAILILSVPVSAKKQQEEVKSTQGVEIDNSITKALKTSDTQKKEQKNKQKTSADYIKTKKQVKRLDSIKENKQREIEYLQNRIEVKKQRLEKLSPTTNEKGEK